MPRMPANETRLLVLGAVSLFEPVNGYQIRRELMSWEVDKWAHINPGSIYSSLSTLTKQGHLHRHDLQDGSREVAVYTTTEIGRSELGSLFGQALETVEVLDPLPLHTALSMCTLFSRDVVLGHLTRRVAALEEHLADLRKKLHLAADGRVPPHVARVLDLDLAHAEVERSWVGELLADIRAGAFGFAGEPMGWEPAADDPGWQMAGDRDRYRVLLGLA
jgi:DNA-binding PadR family transcriptional regulator